VLARRNGGASNDDKSIKHICIFSALTFFIIPASLNSVLGLQNPNPVVYLSGKLTDVANLLGEVGELLGWL
jgi:hypothetical protein